MPNLGVPYTPPKDEMPLPYELDDVFYYRSQDNLASKGIWNNDYGLIANLSQTYMLNEAGELVSASHKPYDVLGSALRGGLFTLDKDGFMRQITLVQNTLGWDFNVSAPMELPKDPPRPSLITRLFAWLVPSWGAEVKEYKRQTAFNAKLSEFGKDSEHPVSFDLKAPRPKVKEEESELTPEPEPEPEPKKKTREEILRTQLNPTDELLSREEFRKYLNTAYNTSLYEDLDVLQSENPTAEKYLEALARRVEYVAISEIYGEHNGSPDREYVYDNHQRGYWAMKAFLKDYVRQKVDMQKLDEILETGYENSPHKEYFNDLHEFMFNRYLRNNALAEVKDMLRKGQKEVSSSFQGKQPTNSQTKTQAQTKTPEQVMTPEQPVETVPTPPADVTDNEPEIQPEEAQVVTLPVIEQPDVVREFLHDKDFIEKHKDIAMSNDPLVLYQFLNDPNNNGIDDWTREHLTHRLYHLAKMAEQAKTPAHSDLTPTVETTENGETRILLDATQPQQQTTGNGCWSVSLQTQLNYRGVEMIDQMDIRSYRPDGTKQLIEPDLTAEKLNKDEVNSVHNYSTLINTFLPNVAVHNLVFASNMGISRDDKEEILRTIIPKALKDHNSPISFTNNSHYRTIVGMEGDTIYYKDPSVGNDVTHTTTIEDLARKNPQLQLTWLQDLEPDLGGNVKDMNGYDSISANYSGGVYADTTFAKNQFNQEYVMMESLRQHQVESSGKEVPMNSNFPITLSYKRNPAQKTGFAYNMDALEKMRQELKQLSDDGKERGETGSVYASMDTLANKLEGYINGTANIDYAKMYEVAKDYKALADTSGGNDALSSTLNKHLHQVRGALDAHLHYDNRQLGTPHSWPDPGSQAHQQLQQGLAGMIAAKNLQTAVNTNPENWIQGYDPKNVAIAKDNILNGTAFQNMMQKLDRSIEKDRNPNATVVPAKRQAVRLCWDACGGNTWSLMREYGSALNALKKQAQAGNNNAPQKNNVVKQAHM